MPSHTRPRRATSFACSLLLVVALALLPACATRSISDSHYPFERGSYNAIYRGELSDFDVVGLRAASGDTAAAPAPFALPGNARVMVVQSGALFPDALMTAALAERFDVGVASGVPLSTGYGTHGMLDAASRGGFDAVVAYWGVLESKQSTDASAWVPIVGLVLRSTTQQMRLRLRVIVADVRTGRWQSLLVAPQDDERDTSLLDQSASDQEMVATVKSAAYRAAAAAIAGLQREQR